MARGSPFDELERLLDKMNDARERAAGGLAVDVADDGDAFVLTADLPGFEKADIDVEVHERTLRVDARHSEEHEADDEDYIRRERSKRSLSRSVTLPEDVDESGATAEFQNGVLTVTLPKAHGSEDATSVDIE